MTKFCKSALAALKPNIAVYIILLITMVFMYYKCLGHEFVNWDDSRFVLNNEMIQGFTFSHLKMALTKSFDRVFAPVNMLSYMLDYELWGLSFSGFIFTNLVLHFCNSLIFYHLCLKIFNFRSGAALAAFIFLAHPLQVESVAWISERKNVLSMFFFLLSFLSFLSFRTAKKPASIFYYASLIAYSLALLTKMASAFLPLVLALYDYCYYRNEQTRRRVYEYMPYIFLVAALVLVNMRTYVFNEIPLGDYAANGFNTFITMVTVLPKYLIQIIWPQFLSIIYSPPVKEAIDGEVLVSVLVILLLFFEGIILFRSKRRLFFWYAFFFIAFLPVSQIIPLGTIMQDRYCYFPLLGLCGLIGLISGNYFQQMPRTIRNMAIVVIFLSPLALLPLLSQKRVEIWKDSLTLWRETATAGIGNRFGFDSHYVENQLTTEYYLKAEELLKSGNREEALRYYMQTLSADPLHSEALIKTGILLLDMGKYEVAHGYLTRVTEKFPKNHRGFYSLGQYYFRSGNFDKAEGAYRHALVLYPTYTLAMKGLATINFKRNDYKNALYYYKKITASGEENRDNYYIMATLEAATGNLNGACRYLHYSIERGFSDLNAVKQNPFFAPFLNNSEFVKVIAQMPR